MKFTCMFALPLLFGGVEAAETTRRESRLAEVRAKRRLTQEFMTAMHADPKIGGARRKARSEKERKRQLYSNLIKSARPLTDEEKEDVRKLQNNNYNYNYNNGQQQDGQEAQQQGQNYQGQNYQGQNYQGQYAADGQYWMNFDEANFDMTARSFKYAGCAAIKSFDTEKAEENGNPMVTDTYAVFRLCPADSCNKYSMTGCGKNYGEYVIEMKTYLNYIHQYYEDRYEEYCEYCLPCDFEFQQEQAENLSDCYLNQQQNGEFVAMTAQAQAWQDFYDKNNGDMSGWNPNGDAFGENGYVGGFGSYNNYQNSYNHAAQGNYYNTAQHGSGSYYSANHNSAYGNNGQHVWGNQGGNQYEQQQYNNGNNYYGYRKTEEGQDFSHCAYNPYYYHQNEQAQNANNYAANNNGNNYNNYNNGNGDNNGDGDNAAPQYGGYWNANGEWISYQNVQNDDQFANNNEEVYICEDECPCDECQYEVEQENDHNYCDDYICKDYYTYCSDYYSGYEDQFDMFEYLECTEYVADNGAQYYIGPHCGSNHWTITLGVFSDQNCANYIGESVSLQQVLGFGRSDDELFKLPRECISCDGTENYEEEQEQQQEENMGRYGDGQYVNAPDTTDDGIVAMCQVLYQSSAQCNKYMDNYESQTMFMTQQEIDEESRYCSFIDNIIYGAYDEQGEILLRGDSFDLADWRNTEQYKKLKIPASQAVSLALSALLVAVMAASAVMTRRALKRQATPWMPNEGDKSTDFNRQSSGVMMGRTRSGPNSAPLI